MSRHIKRGEPRAHWLLLVLAMLFLLGELCLNGYIRHVGAEGSGAPPPVGEGTAPAAVTDGSPIQRIDPSGEITTRAMPAKTIALTFDDGPDPTWTPKFLDVLARNKAHGTFFVVGSHVNEHPEIADQIVRNGNELGAHTFTHVDMKATAAWQLRLEHTLTTNAIAAATGRRTILLRPPYSSSPGAVTGADYEAMRTASEAGYLIVLTDLDSEDWRRPGVESIVKAVTPARGAGAVVMMHDSGGDRAQTLAALEVLIPKLQAEGYRFTTISEALQLPETSAPSVVQVASGHALRWAQTLASWLANLMTVLMLVAVILAGVRLLVQVITAQIHVRRARRRTRGRLLDLGPVSIIVPAYNESANIEATVRSLLASDYPRLEVIVVDDGSTDGTAAIVERMRLPGVYVIRQENAGKPAALNTGITHARGDILILVDGDTVFNRDAVGRLVQPMRDESVGAVSGNTKVANRNGLLGRWQHLEYVIGFNLDRRMFDLAECMPTVPGAIGAFRREAIFDVGGVSEQTLAEDTDFTMAVIRAGWRVVYAPDAIAWTEAPATLRQLWRQRYRWCYGTMQAMWKHRSALTDRGPSGRLGRRGLGYLMIFQVLLPLTAPMVDVYGIYGALFLPPLEVAAVWGGFTLVQILTAAYALRLDHERYGPLWSLPLQQIVYRQLMYLVVIQSAVMALLGGRLRWHRMARTGAATAHASRVPR